MVIVPLGVDLRPDLQAKIDASEPVKLEYVRCGSVGCTAEAKATTDMMKALKTGRQIAIEAKRPLGRPVHFTLPLAGFATVYDGKASDAKQYQEARQRLVSLIRARRAEQIKKAVQALDNQQQSQQQPLPPQGQPRQPRSCPPTATAAAVSRRRASREEQTSRSSLRGMLEFPTSFAPSWRGSPPGRGLSGPLRIFSTVTVPPLADDASIRHFTCTFDKRSRWSNDGMRGAETSGRSRLSRFLR